MVLLHPALRYRRLERCPDVCFGEADQEDDDCHVKLHVPNHFFVDFFFADSRLVQALHNLTV